MVSLIPDCAFYSESLPPYRKCGRSYKYYNVNKRFSDIPAEPSIYMLKIYRFYGVKME